MTDETTRRFATLLQLALAGRPLRFVEQPDKLFEIAEVRPDGKVRLKLYPMRDPKVSRSDYIVEPWSLELVGSQELELLKASASTGLPAELVPDAIAVHTQRKPRC